jgi:hypothetical protein
MASSTVSIVTAIIVVIIVVFSLPDSTASTFQADL